MQSLRSYVLLALVSGMLFAGCAGSHLMKGNHFYDQMAYSRATPQYEKALKKKNFPEGKHKIADAYRKMNNSVEAEAWYKEVMTLPDVTPMEKLYYGQALIRNGKYAEAKD